jgi:hypothetical protein
VIAYGVPEYAGRPLDDPGAAGHGDQYDPSVGDPAADHAVRRHIFIDVGEGADAHAVTDVNMTEDRGVRADGDTVADHRRPGVALGSRAHGHALHEAAIPATHRVLTDDHRSKWPRTSPGPSSAP